MTDETQNHVLALLAKEWDPGGPPEIMDLFDVTAALPVAPGETLIAIRELFASGLVDLNETKTSVFLTPKGYAAVELMRSD